MAVTFDTLSDQALKLPPEQRMKVARNLIESVETEDALSPDAAWEAEIRERIAQFDAGEVVGIPASEVFRRARDLAAAR
jgi:putative addiction module component (TIGR02574 family)